MRSNGKQADSDNCSSYHSNMRLMPWKRHPSLSVLGAVYIGRTKESWPISVVDAATGDPPTSVFRSVAVVVVK